MVRSCRGCAGRRRRWLETGSGKIPELSWPRPAHVETEQRRSRRKELLGKAQSQRNCPALHNTGREPWEGWGWPGTGHFRQPQPLLRPKSPAPCSPGGKVYVQSWDSWPQRPRTAGHLEAKSMYGSGCKESSHIPMISSHSRGAGISCHCGRPGRNGTWDTEWAQQK